MTVGRARRYCDGVSFHGSPASIPTRRILRRNISPRQDIPEEARPLIDLLVEERLLSSDSHTVKDPQSGAESLTVTIEPAHEALLRQWSLLEGWLLEDFGLLAALEGIKRAARDWEANGKVEAWLAHQGLRLADASALDARPDIVANLDSADRDYLTACSAREAAEAVEAEARRSEREEAQARALSDARDIATANRRIAQRTRMGLIAALLLAVVATAVGGVALRLRGIAADQALIAEQQESVAKSKAEEARRNQAAALATLSRTALPSSPAIAAKLALAAWPRANSDSGPKLTVALAMLGDAITEFRERRVLRGHGGPVASAAFSPDGARVVTASSDATARVWDSADGSDDRRAQGPRR